MGSRRRLDYTVFGPTVNLAQRLEVSCEPDGVLVSHETLGRVTGVVRVAQEKEVEAKNIGIVKAYQIASMEES
jgi:class 3 adenylate cyclase